MSNAPAIAAMFARTAEGHLAAQVDDLGWLAIPVAGGLRMASAWRLSKPIDAWVSDRLLWCRRVRRRRGSHSVPMSRMWRSTGASWLRCLALRRGCGSARHGEPRSRATATLTAFICHSTAGHGGFYLGSERNALVHAMWRNGDGWYEEDAEWAKVAFALPGLFTTRERRCAAETLRNAVSRCLGAHSRRDAGTGRIPGEG